MTCPVCRQVFKMHHHVKVHMGIHRGEKFPCRKCGKVLATRRTWTELTKACVQGNWVACPVCGWEYASVLVMHQHHHAKHGADAAAPREGISVHFVGRCTKSKILGRTINHTVWTTLTEKVLIIVGLLDVHQPATPSPVWKEPESSHVQHAQMEGVTHVRSQRLTKCPSICGE